MHWCKHLNFMHVEIDITWNIPTYIDRHTLFIHVQVLMNICIQCIHVTTKLLKLALIFGRKFFSLIWYNIVDIWELSQYFIRLTSDNYIDVIDISFVRHIYKDQSLKPAAYTKLIEFMSYDDGCCYDTLGLRLR